MKYLFALIFTITVHYAYAEKSRNFDGLMRNDYQLSSNFHFYVSELARQLFGDKKYAFSSDDLVAVGSFLPVDDLKGDQVPASSNFGLQLQESLITLATQQGLSVVEYKTVNQLNMGPRFDVMLSRDLKRIRKEFEVNYFLTGTYSYEGDAYLVNARLIDVKTRSVVAAATDLVPGVAEDKRVSASQRGSSGLYFVR